MRAAPTMGIELAPCDVVHQKANKCSVAVSDDPALPWLTWWAQAGHHDDIVIDLAERDVPGRVGR